MYFIIYYSYVESETIFNMKALNYEDLDYKISYIKNTLNAKIEYIKVKEL